MNHPVIPATFLLQNQATVVSLAEAQRTGSVADRVSSRVRSAWQALGDRTPAAPRTDLAA